MTAISNILNLEDGYTARQKLLILIDLYNKLAVSDVSYVLQRIDPAYIKAAAPLGKFLKDDGTWSNPLADSFTVLYETAADWTAANPILGLGYVGVELDSLMSAPKFKFFNGVNAWNSLPYAGKIQSITGALVDNTNPSNPVILTPALWQVLLSNPNTGGYPISSPNGSSSITVANGVITYNSLIHLFNNILNLSGLNLTYNGNGDGLLEINTGNDYGGISSNTQKVKLNGNSGYIELYSSATNTLRVSQDGNKIELYTPKIIFDSVNITANSTVKVLSGFGIDTTVTAGSDVLNIGVTNANVINIGSATAIVNMLGAVINEYATNAYVTDKLITLNDGGAVSSGIGVGFEIEENNVITGYFKTNASRDGFSILVPAILFKSDLNLNLLTADRVHSLPDVDGTLALISQTITNGVTTKAPSEDVVFDALAGKADKQDGLVSGGTITIGTYGGTGTNNDIRIASPVWFISPNNYTVVGNTDFNDIVLAATGMQRIVGLYGDNTNTITKVEGVDALIADPPATPVGKALLGYALVSDAGISAGADFIGYLLKSSKATGNDINTGTDDAKYLTSLGVSNSRLLGQNLTKISATASGTNTYAITLSPVPTAYASTQMFKVIFTNANTGASTINVNGLGAKSLIKNNGAALLAGDIQAGSIWNIAYDGTNMRMLGMDFTNNSVIAKSANFTVGPTELGATYNVTTAASTITATLPTPFNGWYFNIKKVDSGVGIAVTSTATIACARQNQLIQYTYNGTTWQAEVVEEGFIPNNAIMGNTSGAETYATEQTVVDGWLSAGTAATDLENVANWTGVNYTGTAITGTYKGQRHYNATYLFTAVADNSWIRTARA